MKGNFKMTTIYLVNACDSYEGHSTICAFNSKSDAESLVKYCQEFDKMRPICPDIDAGNEVWVEWDEKYKTWGKTHPAGCEHEYYGIEEISLK